MRITFCQTHRSFSVQRPSRFISLSILASAFIAVLALATDAWAGYRATNLVSDIPGVARRTDANLVNPWGIAVGKQRHHLGGEQRDWHFDPLRQQGRASIPDRYHSDIRDQHGRRQPDRHCLQFRLGFCRFRGRSSPVRASSSSSVKTGASPVGVPRSPWITPSSRWTMERKARFTKVPRWENHRAVCGFS